MDLNEELVSVLVVSVLLGIVFWFFIIPYLQVSVFLINANPFYEGLMDALVLGIGFLVLNSLGFRAFRAIGGE